MKRLLIHFQRQKLKLRDLENELYEFRTQLAKSMWYALDSAGWYWRDGFRKSDFTVPEKQGLLEQAGTSINIYYQLR